MDVVLEALRAAADPSRLRILLLLSLGELTVGELVGVLVQSQPRVSRHLKVLTDAGLLERFREGSRVFYRLRRDRTEAKIAQRIIAMIPQDDVLRLQDRERLKDIERKRAERASKTNALKCMPEIERLRELGVDEVEVERAVRDMLPLSKAQKLLDMGTGTGHMLSLLGPDAGESLGVDKSSEVLAVARDRIRQGALREKGQLENCQLRQADILALPLADNSFDAVVLHQVLHYLEQPCAAIAQAARMLVPGGRLLVVDLARHHADDLHEKHGHRHLGFTDNEICDCLDTQGLQCETIRHLAHGGSGRLRVTLWLARRAEDRKQGVSP